MPPTDVMPQVVYVEVRRKRRWPWVLGVFALLGVICCGVCVAATAPIRKEYPSQIAAVPDQMAGLRMDDSGLVKLIVDEAEHRIRTEQGVDDAFAAAFADPRAADRKAIVFGATRLLWNPAGDLDKAIQGAGQSLSGITAFPAGRMGGDLKCANGKDDQGTAVVICAWVDHGSLGIGVFYGGRPMDNCANFLRALREAIIIRP